MKRTSAFTIVELLIVIVVIAILAAIAIVAYRGIQVRAQGVVIADGLRKIDKGFTLWAMQEGFTRWVPETVGGGGLSIESRINDDTPPWNSLRTYLSRPPDLQNIASEPWFYDNDEPETTYTTCMANPTIPACMGDDKAECTPTNSAKLTGVNIMIRWLRDDSEQLARVINDSIDGTNESANWAHCGKVRYYFNPDKPSGERAMIIYSISYTKALQ